MMLRNTGILGWINCIRIPCLWLSSALPSRPLTIQPGHWPLTRNLYIFSCRATSSLQTGWPDALLMALPFGEAFTQSSLSRLPLNMALLQSLPSFSLYLLSKPTYSKAWALSSSPFTWSYMDCPSPNPTPQTNWAKDMSWGRDIGPSVSNDMGAEEPVSVAYTCLLVLLELHLRCTFPSYEKLHLGPSSCLIWWVWQNLAHDGQFLTHSHLASCHQVFHLYQCQTNITRDCSSKGI